MSFMTVFLEERRQCSFGFRREEKTQFLLMENHLCSIDQRILSQCAYGAWEVNLRMKVKCSVLLDF